MFPIEITATCESISQAKQLLTTEIDYLYFGDEKFALRMPTPFSWSEIETLTQLTHQANKKVTVAVNAIMHPDKMKEIPEYLNFLTQIGVDRITVGDTGVIFVINRDQLDLPFIYDASTMVTSARQINFWAKHGANGAVLAREIPKLELVNLSQRLTVFGQIQVYGASVIHQSKRPLLQNYYNFIGSDEAKSKARNLFLSEPKKHETHYSIYEDGNGTHIFANNDLNLMPVLNELAKMKLNHWLLDGIYTAGESFVEITKLFSQAKIAIENQTWDLTQANLLAEKVRELHPETRGLDTGFYQIDPESIK
ncbi:MAG: U32 family peptidase [Streptococcaceae bacterium]|jgi:collagenase-like PrtC family protease|nr:U32 family peptidase [Streptococcaceae bacterium]